MDINHILDFLLNLSRPVSYLAIFGILLACGLGLPIPEDITLFCAGLLSYYGVTDLWITIGLCYFGVILGDSIIFFLGAKMGHRITRIAFFRRVLPPERLLDVADRFRQKGNRLIFLARFMPGLRAPIYFSAGTLKLPYRVFFFYDGLAALLSVPVIIGVVFRFGDEVTHLIQKVEHGVVVAVFTVLALLIGKWYLSRRKAKRTSQ